MLFNSAEFLFLFLPLTFALFFITARHGGGTAIHVLGLASLAFYSYWDISFLPILLASVIGNFFVSRAIAHFRSHTRPILFLGVALNLAALAFYKYADFFIGTVNSVAGTQETLLGLALPLGISFFTFTQIAFLVDTARRETSEPSFGKYLLFVTYFPHLIAGPILHHKQMIPQFNDPDVLRIRLDSIAVGLTLLTIGLIKKVFIADHFAEYATPVFTVASGDSTLPPAEAWAGALAYTFQLYFDFSGYCDMALGISRLFNIDLPVNFNSPYKAVNIIDFWRRWHISLSNFLRDYLYIPLGGNRHGKFRRYLNLFLTMLLGGLWHGANWTFVVWGAIHGGLLVVNHAFDALRQRYPWLQMPAPVAVALTFLAVVLAWVPFRADSFNTAVQMWAAMFSLPDAASAWHETVSGIRLKSAYTAIVVGLLLVWCLPNSQTLVARHWRNSTDPREYHSRIAWQPTLRIGVLLGILFAVTVMSLGRVSEFLYFQF